MNKTEAPLSIRNKTTTTPFGSLTVEIDGERKYLVLTQDLYSTGTDDRPEYRAKAIAQNGAVYEIRWDIKAPAATMRTVTLIEAADPVEALRPTSFSFEFQGTTYTTIQSPFPWSSDVLNTVHYGEVCSAGGFERFMAIWSVSPSEKYPATLVPKFVFPLSLVAKNKVEAMRLRGKLECYERWECKRSGEDFDRAQHLATELSEVDRLIGDAAAPRYGYSARRFAEAQAIVKRANRWS